MRPIHIIKAFAVTAAVACASNGVCADDGQAAVAPMLLSYTAVIGKSAT